MEGAKMHTNQSDWGQWLETNVYRNLTTSPTFWTAERRMHLLLRLLRGDITVLEAAQRYQLHPDVILRWRKSFLAGARESLASLD